MLTRGEPLEGETYRGNFLGADIAIVVDLVLYLASPASNFICGQVVRIDGGYSAV